MTKNNLTTRVKVALALAITLLACFAVTAQEQQKFARAQEENARQLRQYRWKSRTEIRKDGETKSIQLALMGYDLDGNIQRTPISSTPAPNLPTRGLRGLIAKKKKEDFMKTLEGLQALAKSYGELPPGKMQHFMASAAITPEITLQQRLIRIEGRDVLQPGDAMTIWVDAATRRQRRVEIQTFFDKEQVRIVSEFQDLPNGPTHMARSVIDYRSDELTVITENFDYMREQRQTINLGGNLR